jgi:hypothetical protein
MTYRILLGTEFGPEVALVSEVEGGGNAVVGLLKSDDLESADVIHAMKFACGTGPKGGAPYTDLTHFVDDVIENVLHKGPISQLLWVAICQVAYLDCSQRRSREFQRPLDLEPV